MASPESQVEENSLTVKLLNPDEKEGQDLITKVWQEVIAQYRIGWPMVISGFLSFSFNVVGIMFLGHLGELELSSAAMANSVAAVTGFTLMIGLGSTLETLCGQAYGAKNYYLMSVYMQAAMIVMLSFCLPIFVFWFNIETVLLWLGQDVEICRLASLYLRCLMPGLLCCSILQPLIRFLQTQSVVLPTMICSLIGAIFHPFLCYFMIYKLGLGYLGGGLSIMLSYWFLLIMIVSYIYFSNTCRKTWIGFVPRDAFRTTGLFIRIAIPSMGMTCLEYWSYEILLLLSGLLVNPELELSLMSICFTTSMLVYMAAIGLSVAASTRVSNSLGANRPDEAKFAAKVAMSLGILQAFIIFTVMMAVRNFWGRAFSDADQVLNYVAEVMPWLALASLMDGIQGVLAGVTRGSGRQKMGAYINLAAFYIVGIPVGRLLAFNYQFYGKGLVMGLACGDFTQMTSLIVLVLSTNWEKMADEAQKRVNGPQQKLLPTTVETSEESST